MPAPHALRPLRRIALTCSAALVMLASLDLFLMAAITVGVFPGPRIMWLAFGAIPMAAFGVFLARRALATPRFVLTVDENSKLQRRRSVFALTLCSAPFAVMMLVLVGVLFDYVVYLVLTVAAHFFH